MVARDCPACSGTTFSLPLLTAPVKMMIERIFALGKFATSLGKHLHILVRILHLG